MNDWQLCVPALGSAADLPCITMGEVAISQARPAGCEGKTLSFDNYNIS